VLQVLSSGAAIGRYGPRRFAPSFGAIDIEQTPEGNGQVRVGLWAQDKDLRWVRSTPDTPLAYTRDNWADALEAEASADVEAPPDTEPLLALNARQQEHPGTTGPDAKPLEELDPEFSARQPAPGYPQPLTLVAEGQDTVRLTRATHSQVGEEGQLGVTTQVERVFQRALEQGRKSVVLFIHGFGKSFSDSAAQAYDLRASYPGCEPLLYTWPAGRGGGALTALWGFHDAITSAEAGAAGLAAVLSAFGAASASPRFSGLATVVLARSAGSVALNEALCTHEPGFGGALDGVTRILLSAPLLKQSAFNRRGGLGGLSRTPVVITRNRNDHTLRMADWVDGFGPILGLDDDFDVHHPDAWCLDFTESAWVGRLHDHLLPHINPAQHGLTEWLLTERSAFHPDLPALSGLIAHRRNRVIWPR
jgi:hypothetical protein